MEWSQHDAMVIAVAWQRGGLSVWSVFGVLLYYSHGDQPGYVMVTCVHAHIVTHTLNLLFGNLLNRGPIALEVYPYPLLQ